MYDVETLCFEMIIMKRTKNYVGNFSEISYTFKKHLS
jgi:hypothetical protein